MATFTSNHDVNETVTVNGQSGTVKSVAFTSPTNPVYTIEVPEHTEVVPGSTVEDSLDG